jgi:hypothetical protein
MGWPVLAADALCGAGEIRERQNRMEAREFRWGTVLGERGSRIILDDPNSTPDIESDATRYRTELFFSEVLPDRLGNLEEDAVVIIMQRLHEWDV